MNNNIDVSVIVPVYNVEEYLEECLDSLLRQGDISIEAIIIDDGSTDSSGIIADRYAREYPHFKCFHIKNNGLGHARNYGVTQALGKYIAFLDSDDLIPDYTYSKMITLAEKHNAELTICNVERYKSKETSPSPQHQKTFLGYEEVSHITHNYHLVYDTISCNKLINREFYLKNNFKFPEHILYEDIPVTIPMHFKCNKVAMMKEVGYLWRLREGSNKSITQRVSSLNNLTDRLKIMKMLDAFFMKNVDDKNLEKAKEYKNLDIDLKVFINKSLSMTEEEITKMFDLINDYIDSDIDEDLISKLPILDRQKYYYVRNRDVEGLLKLLHYVGYSFEPVTEMDGELSIELPAEVFTIEDRNITEEFKRRFPNVGIEKISIFDKCLEITGYVYWDRLNMEYGDQQIKVAISDNIHRIDLDVEPHKSEYLTKRCGLVIAPYTNRESEYNYEGAGFRTVVNLDEICKETVEKGLFHFEIDYKNRFFEGTEILRGITNNKKADINGSIIVVKNHCARIIINQSDELNIIISNNFIHAEDIVHESDSLTLMTNKEAYNLQLINEMSCEEDRVTLKKKGQNNYRIKYEELISGKSYRLISKSEDTKTEIISKINRLFIDCGDALAIANTDKNGALHLIVENKCTLAQLTKEKKGAVVLNIKKRLSDELADKVVAIRAIAKNRINEEWICLAEKKRDNKAILNDSLEIRVFIRKVSKHLYSANRQIYFEYEYESGEKRREPIYCTDDSSFRLKKDDLQVKFYSDAYLRLRVDTKQLWPEGMTTKENRKHAVNTEYPKYLKMPINKMRIFFESMEGSSYSCNPRAIYEYINRNYPEYECIWALNDVRIPIKGRAKKVRKGSLKYYEYLATSQYLINNENFPEKFTKREGQILIHAMQGAPIKTIGLDAPGGFSSQLAADKYVAKNQKWDYLLLNGKFIEDNMSRMFGVTPNGLRAGSPRTDILMRSDLSRVKNLKSKIGIPPEKKVLMYAPTWRYKGNFNPPIDYKELKARLGDEYVLMVRLHRFNKKLGNVCEDGDFIFNMSDYSSVEELCLITDVLITDYSSLAFDYMLLQRPIVFFAYDLEQYKNKIRGTYIDLENEAPGPICMNTDEIINTINNIEDEQFKYDSKSIHIREKYLTYERSDSTRKVVAQAIKPSVIKHYYYKINKKLKKLKRK